MYTFMWGSITLRRCVFRDNWAGEFPTCHAGSKTGHGGALFTDRGILTVFDSVFVNNSQAVWMWSTKESKNSNETLRNVTLSNCTFTGNHVNGSGGAVYNQWSTLYITHSRFRENTATKMGAAIASDAQSETYVSACDFDMVTNVPAKGVGSGVYNSGGEREAANCVIGNDTVLRVRANESTGAAAEAAIKSSFYACRILGKDGVDVVPESDAHVEAV